MRRPDQPKQKTVSLFKNRPLAAASLFLFLGALSAYLLHIGGMTRIYTLIPLFLLGAAPVASLFTVKRTGILLITVLAALFVGYFSQILYENITSCQNWQKRSL